MQSDIIRYSFFWTTIQYQYQIGTHPVFTDSPCVWFMNVLISMLTVPQGTQNYHLNGLTTSEKQGQLLLLSSYSTRWVFILQHIWDANHLGFISASSVVLFSYYLFRRFPIMVSDKAWSWRPLTWWSRGWCVLPRWRGLCTGYWGSTLTAGRTNMTSGWTASLPTSTLWAGVSWQATSSNRQLPRVRTRSSSAPQPLVYSPSLTLRRPQCLFYISVAYITWTLDTDAFTPDLYDKLRLWYGCQ